MGSVTDGVYRIGVDGRQNLSAMGREMVVVLPEEGPGQEWKVERANNGHFTIRPASTPLFLGFDGYPDTFERVFLLPEQREWEIADGPRPGTHSIGVLDSKLTLGLHPALIFPPMVALSPVFGEDRGWTFQKLH